MAIASTNNSLNEASVYIWELTRGINSLKELAWARRGFLRASAKFTV